MKKRVEVVFVFILILLGIVHTVLTPVFFKDFDDSFMWFVGTGLGFIYLGFINLGRVMGNGVVVNILCSLGNWIGIVFVMTFFVATGEIAFQAVLLLVTLVLLEALARLECRKEPEVKYVEGQV